MYWQQVRLGALQCLSALLMASAFTSSTALPMNGWRDAEAPDPMLSEQNAPFLAYLASLCLKASEDECSAGVNGSLCVHVVQPRGMSMLLASHTQHFTPTNASMCNLLATATVSIHAVRIMHVPAQHLIDRLFSVCMSGSSGSSSIRITALQCLSNLIRRVGPGDAWAFALPGITGGLAKALLAAGEPTLCMLPQMRPCCACCGLFWDRHPHSHMQAA